MKRILQFLKFCFSIMYVITYNIQTQRPPMLYHKDLSSFYHIAWSRSLLILLWPRARGAETGQNRYSLYNVIARVYRDWRWCAESKSKWMPRQRAQTNYGLCNPGKSQKKLWSRRDNKKTLQFLVLQCAINHCTDLLIVSDNISMLKLL